LRARLSTRACQGAGFAGQPRVNLTRWHRRRAFARWGVHFAGESDPVVLEFDHVRGRKRAPLERLVSVGCSREALLAELDKCVVRCANCHRRRTAQTRGYRRYRFVAEQAELSERSVTTDAVSDVSVNQIRTRLDQDQIAPTAADGPDSPG
jgi:hypothetical protein